MIGGRWAMWAGAGTTCAPTSKDPSDVSMRPGNASGAGPLDVKDVTPFLHPMRQNWLDAAAELGLPLDR